LQTKHIKPTASTPQGSIEKREGSIHLSNIMVIDPKTGNPTRTGKKINEKGKLQRYSKTSGNLL
jgi:large subunit ribosomal protein L24